MAVRLWFLVFQGEQYIHVTLIRPHQAILLFRLSCKRRRDGHCLILGNGVEDLVTGMVVNIEVQLAGRTECVA
jgi:hypothetical protein